MDEGQELYYGLGPLTVQEYEAALDELWDQLKDPNSDVSREAKKRNIDIEPVRAVERKDAIRVSTDESPFGAEVTLIIALAPLATAVVKAAAPSLRISGLASLGHGYCRVKGPMLCRRRMTL